MILRLVLLLTLISLSGLCLAGLHNVTIDDTTNSTDNASINFTPPNAWTVEHSASGNMSWHRSKYDPHSLSTAPTATLFFTGSAVYVYCVLMQNASGNLTFHLDGTISQRPLLATSQSEKPEIVFFNTSLSMAQHSLVIQNDGDPNSPSVSDFSLDSIIVTVSQDPPSDSKDSKPQAGVIVGSVLGSLAVIPLVGLGYLLYIRRNKQSADTESPPQNQDTQKQSCRWKSLTLPSIRPTSLSPRLNAPNPQPVRAQQAAKPFQIDGSSRGHTGPPAPNHMSESPNPPSSPWFVEPTQRINRVHRWQQETHEATRDTQVAPTDMSEELSSYYDDNATESQRYRPGTPPPPSRRFVVRNN